MHKKGQPMTRSVNRLANAAAVVGVCACCLVLAGCGDPEAASTDHIELLGLHVRDYHDKYGKPPEALAELEEFFGSQQQYDSTMNNPLTGDDPGYLYVKPPAGVMDSSLSHRVVMLYQLRGGQKAEDLPVGYADGRAGPVEKLSITDTIPAWREFTSPEAGCTLTLPAEPDVDHKDPDNITLSAKFCGLEYGLVVSRNPMSRMAVQLGPERFLQEASASLARSRGARVASSEAIRCGSHPGLAATLDGVDRDAELQVHWFLVGDRLICLNVSGPKGSLNEENAGRFFASLQLLDR